MKKILLTDKKIVLLLNKINEYFYTLKFYAFLKNSFSYAS